MVHDKVQNDDYWEVTGKISLPKLANDLANDKPAPVTENYSLP